MRSKRTASVQPAYSQRTAIDSESAGDRSRRRRASFLKSRLTSGRVRDLFQALADRLPERDDQIAEAHALKIAELTDLAERARAKVAILVERIAGEDRASISAFAAVVNAITRAEGTCRRAQGDFDKHLAGKQKGGPTLLQQHLARKVTA